jgi:hypothetical protein
MGSRIGRRLPQVDKAGDRLGPAKGDAGGITGGELERSQSSAAAARLRDRQHAMVDHVARALVNLDRFPIVVLLPAGGDRANLKSVCHSEHSNSLTLGEFRSVLFDFAPNPARLKFFGSRSGNIHPGYRNLTFSRISFFSREGRRVDA